MTTRATLAERLQALLLVDGELADVPVAAGNEPQSTSDRILDAAQSRFAEVGINSTTMSSIAAEAELSREWLYKHFSNRDAIVAAVTQRELRRFIDGLAARPIPNDDVIEWLTESFVYVVEFLRDNPMVDGLVDREVTVGGGELRERINATVGVAVRGVAGYLVDLGGFDPVAALIVAETLSRLVGSTVLAPQAALDLHDPAGLRGYAARVVPAVVRGC